MGLYSQRINCNIQRAEGSKKNNDNKISFLTGNSTIDACAEKRIPNLSYFAAALPNKNIFTKSEIQEALDVSVIFTAPYTLVYSPLYSLKSCCSYCGVNSKDTSGKFASICRTLDGDNGNGNGNQPSSKDSKTKTSTQKSDATSQKVSADFVFSFEEKKKAKKAAREEAARASKTMAEEREKQVRKIVATWVTRYLNWKLPEDIIVKALIFVDMCKTTVTAKLEEALDATNALVAAFANTCSSIFLSVVILLTLGLRAWKLFQIDNVQATNRYADFIGLSCWQIVLVALFYFELFRDTGFLMNITNLGSLIFSHLLRREVFCLLICFTEMVALATMAHQSNIFLEPVHLASLFPGPIVASLKVCFPNNAFGVVCYFCFSFLVGGVLVIIGFWFSY